LSRRPKQLTSEPTVFEVGGDGRGGTVLIGQSEGKDADGARRAGAARVVTDQRSDEVRTEAEAAVVDPRVRAAAREIAERLSIRRPRYDSAGRRGVGLVQSVPFRDGADDIDLDRTLELMAERPVFEDEDIVVRERVRTRRSVVLAVDLSGSMREERVRTAAATVGALAAELIHDDLAVVAFWSDAAWLSRFGTEIQAHRLLEQLLAIPTRGLTNVALPLALAGRELAGSPAADARVLLLSDCVHNAGPDPRSAAAGLPRLDVLLDVFGENDLELGRQLARIGHGRLRPVRHYHDVAPGLTEIFAP
jgi:Mg-chelatase subunit ChlD